MTDEEFAELFNRMYPSVLAWLAKSIGWQDAPDLANTAFEIVWKKRNEPRDNPDALDGWVWGIARFQVKQFLDKKGRRHHDSRFIEDHQAARRVADLADPAAEVVERLDAERIRDQLTETDRLLFDLAIIQGLPAAEVEAALRISHSAYATRLTRVRQRIERMMAASETEEQP